MHIRKHKKNTPLGIFQFNVPEHINTILDALELHWTSQVWLSNESNVPLRQLYS